MIMIHTRCANVEFLVLILYYNHWGELGEELVHGASVLLL